MQTPPGSESQLSPMALIPAWNEGPRLGRIVTATREHMPVLVVDDGSADETPVVAAESGAEVVRHPVNRGKGVALLTGFKWALESGYDAVITLDADGQHDPAEIPLFLQCHAEESADLIIGRRDFGRMPIPRRFTNPFGSWLLSLAVGARVYDSQSGYRLHSRRLLEAIQLKSTGFELETEIIIQAVVRGLRLGWVPIETIYGVGETSYYHPVKDSLQFFRMVAHAYRVRREWSTGASK